jgi:MoaA/NifB/PqqE/SkfB family radical SAM enzyme
MCFPQASSKISFYYSKWGLQQETSNNNWTLNTSTWNKFKENILLVKNLNRLHLMGGEPLLNKRFDDLLIFLLENTPDISLSFVTNGTFINDNLISSLKKFKSCDIEVSLESVLSNNDYIRQGSNTSLIIANIKKLVAAQNDRFKVVLRSAPQLLSINTYDKYIEFALEHGISIQGIPLIRPAYMQISVLPKDLRKSFIPKFIAVRDRMKIDNETATIITGRNIAGLKQQLRRECDSMINMLAAPEPTNVQELRQELSKWLIRWDKEYQLNARKFYPEYAQFLTDIGYDL